MDRLPGYDNCALCPRNCHADRRIKKGFCKCSDKVKIARAALHYWEEPCISGSRGSGAVFFSGCTIRCCFCQNHEISSGGFGQEITVERLADIFLELQDKGAHNINLVTPSQFLPSIIEALDRVKHRLLIPVVYNCGGYEKQETLHVLKDYIDIYLPDIKFYDSGLSEKYVQAGDYFEYTSRAVRTMIQQTGEPVFDSEGLMKSGVIIRHMVMPGAYKDSLKILEWMNSQLPEKKFMISLMSQYTPFYKASEHPEINRRITTYEYQIVVDKAIEFGFTDGYMQEKSSAKEEYTPPFNLEGV